METSELQAQIDICQVKIQAILESILPKSFNIQVKQYTWAIGKAPYIHILFSPNEYEINRVKGQYPQVVSLYLNVGDMELQVSHHGGLGGRNINVKPSSTIYYCENVKVPFRTPQKNEKNVMSAIEKFATNYLKIMKENKFRLMYTEYVDYSFLDKL